MRSKKYNKILITGALGHIGSHLIRNLDKSVVRDVILMDNLESQRFPSLYNLPKGFSFKFIKDDITTADFRKYLKGVDAVIHLAAITDAEKSKQMAEQVEAVTYQGLARVAEACLKSKI